MQNQSGRKADFDRSRSGILILAVFLGLGAWVRGAEEKTPPARYVFLFIGDGMGPNQVRLAQLGARALQEAGQREQAALHMDALTHRGSASTDPFGGGTTDSAAAGTALSCARKTKNGVIAMNPEKTEAWTTLAEAAQAQGARVGILSSVSLDHATPAAFYAHAKNRGQYADISAQLPESGFEFFAGGGLKGGGETLATFPQKGYRVLQTLEEIRAFTPGGKCFLIAPERDGQQAMPYALDRGEDQPTLAEFVRLGIAQLRNEKGFFMMVEGGKIDWACHNNDAASCLRDTLAFDDAIGEAMRFAREHPAETLIVVTADHETGGLTLSANVDVAPVLAQAVSHAAFDNRIGVWKEKELAQDMIIKQICSDFGFEALSDEEAKRIEAALEGEWLPKDKRDSGNGGYDKKNPLRNACLDIVDRRAGVEWKSRGHTPARVPVMAFGAHAGAFAGELVNTDIPARLAEAMGVGNFPPEKE